MDVDTNGIIVGSGAVGLLCGLATTWIKAKVGQKLKRPLDSSDLFVRCAECAEHRKALTQRIDELGPALNRIFGKLNENDARDEERIKSVHRRVDPMIEKLAAVTAEVEMFKEFARKSTVGGRK